MEEEVEEEAEPQQEEESAPRESVTPSIRPISSVRSEAKPPSTEDINDVSKNTEQTSSAGGEPISLGQADEATPDDTKSISPDTPAAKQSLTPSPVQSSEVVARKTPTSKSATSTSKSATPTSKSVTPISKSDKPTSRTPSAASNRSSHSIGAGGEGGQASSKRASSSRSRSSPRPITAVSDTSPKRESDTPKEDAPDAKEDAENTEDAKEDAEDAAEENYTVTPPKTDLE